MDSPSWRTPTSTCSRRRGRRCGATPAWTSATWRSSPQTSRATASQTFWNGDFYFSYWSIFIWWYLAEFLAMIYQLSGSEALIYQLLAQKTRIIMKTNPVIFESSLRRWLGLKRRGARRCTPSSSSTPTWWPAIPARRPTRRSSSSTRKTTGMDAR